TPYLFLQFLVMSHNEHEIPKMKRLAKELGVDRLLIKTTQVMTTAEADEWLPKDERYRRYDIQDDSLQVKRGKGICPRVWLTTLVDWDGQVVPCCFDKNGEYPFGTIENEAFADIWVNKSYTAFRRQMLIDRSVIDICRLCNYGIGLFK
ncbi:MAG: radical SAM/SPASM domain-containing protein, partial [Calditrichaeota bacterium]